MFHLCPTSFYFPAIKAILADVNARALKLVRDTRIQRSEFFFFVCEIEVSLSISLSLFSKGTSADRLSPFFSHVSCVTRAEKAPFSWKARFKHK